MTPPIFYTLTFLPAEQAVEVVADFPADGVAHLDLVMAVWSPGFYRLEDYAARVSGLVASGVDGAQLDVEQLAANRWRVAMGGAATARVHYRLACSDQSVTTNWVDQRAAVLNGPATFLMPAGAERRPCEVRLVLPDGWQVQTALPSVDEEVGRFYAASFDVLADSPILAGDLEVHTFDVEGCAHYLVLAGERNALDGARAAQDLAGVLRAHHDFWGFLPFRRYHVLVICRPGGGGLEHADSMLVTATPARVATPDGYRAWIGLASHEYFHALNVKRLRPVELGPFDYQRPPRTAGLWFAEGITCYYGELLLCRAGFASEAEALASLSTQIDRLQAMPGRLVQTLEQSSADVWNNSFSGLNTAPDAVSYYTKGHVVAFLLDVEIQRATGGAAALDDLMRLAYRRFSGERGFTPEQIRALTAELGGEATAVWLDAAVSSTAELDYGPALEWLGLRFDGAQEGAPNGSWRLVAASEGDDAAQHRQTWLRGGLPALVAAKTELKAMLSQSQSVSLDQLERVRGFCLAKPETSERLSHGEPTFFVHKRVFVMFADNHHGDGRLAVWLPTLPGVQTGLIESAPETYFKPPYVGGRGWVGIELQTIADDELSYHIQVAWERVAPKRLLRPAG